MYSTNLSLVGPGNDGHQMYFLRIFSVVWVEELMFQRFQQWKFRICLGLFSLMALRSKSSTVLAQWRHGRKQSSEEWWKEDALRVCNSTVLLFNHAVDVLWGMLWGKSCRYLKTQDNVFLKFIAVRRLGIMQTNERDNCSQLWHR